MQARTLIRFGTLVSGTLAVAACVPFQQQTLPPPAVPASAPAPAPVPPPPPPTVVIQQPDPADVAARRFLAYHEQIRQMSPNDLGSEINRLNGVVSATATAAPADAVLELALALSQQHNGGDVARAIALLEPLTRSSAPELQPWQGLARLLLARVSEQRRLEDLLEKQNQQRREQQRSLQQLNEKLEALKAIERSMTTRPAGAGVAPVALPPAASAAASTPPALPKAP
jgi:hypothetical protein